MRASPCPLFRGNINYIATDYAEKDAVPGMRRMNKIGEIPTKEFYALFPNGPIKKAGKILFFLSTF